jgi:isopentenyldiphosphate isomerase
MEEIFDVVDENDRPLGITKPRSEVHRSGLWHRVVHIYLFNDHDEYLVHQRATTKDLNPNLWDTRFGGHVLSGEHYDTAVVRELRDEIGLEVPLSNFISGEIYARDGGTNREFTKVYYYPFRGDVRQLSFSDGEVQRVKWMNKSEIEKALSGHPEEWAPHIEGFRTINAELEKRVASAR